MKFQFMRFAMIPAKVLVWTATILCTWEVLKVKYLNYHVYSSIVAVMRRLLWNVKAHLGEPKWIAKEFKK
jgi:hypothetical protein